MRTCCCCIPVLAGATVIGVLGMLFTLAFMTPLTTYLIELEEFDPIRANMASVQFQLDKSLREANVSLADISTVNNAIEEYIWYGVLILEVLAGSYLLFALCMIIGIHCDMRGLMIPYLMYQMLLIILAILLGLVLTIGMFLFQNTLLGVVSVVVLLIFSFLLVYYWVAVQKAFVELGNRDYMYSPAPTKAYNGSHHYPSAPQRFEMQEQRM